jgi:hypothetical protein
MIPCPVARQKWLACCLNQQAEDVAGRMDEKLAVLADTMRPLFKVRVLTKSQMSKWRLCN